jgi:hypothetical protein
VTELKLGTGASPAEVDSDRVVVLQRGETIDLEAPIGLAR